MDLVVTSDGETIENRNIIDKYEKKLKGLNRWFSRSKDILVKNNIVV